MLAQTAKLSRHGLQLLPRRCIGQANALFERGCRFPAERVDATYVQQFARCAVLLSGIEDNFAVILEYTRNEFRSIKPEYLVVVGICSHLGCSLVDKFKPQAEPFEHDWKGGFYCPCHGSLFDLAGRVYKNKPAPDNLTVPPHTYLSDTKILIGEDKKGA